MKTETQERVSAFWTDLFFGGSVGGEDGPVIVEHGERLAGYAGIYCIRRQGVVFVSAPGPLVRSVNGWGPSVETVMDVQWWKSHLPGWLVLGPSVHSFLDQPDLLSVAVDETVVRDAGQEDLAHLRDQVTDAEWAESGFAGDDVAQAWVVTDWQDQPLAASNLTWFGDIPADVGVLVASSARGRGLATAAAAAAAGYAVEHHGVARWRALAINAGSRRIAARLGFEGDCLQLAVRPE